jgi:hypothetical protein
MVLLGMVRMRVDLRLCLRVSATTAVASSDLVITLTFGLLRSFRITKLGVATSSRAIGGATGTTPSRHTVSPSAASRTDALILYFFENYPYFKGTLMPQMVMIRYDFIISDYHLNQRSLRSIIRKIHH